MHKKLLEKIKERSSKEDLMCLIDITGMVLDKMKEEDHDFYEYLEALLYENVYGKVISEEMAEKWVMSMTPYHLHWTKEQTDSVMKQYAPSVKPLDFFVVLNMMYNDYKDVLETEEVDTYARLAKGWLMDSDAKEDKLYCYYKNIVKH